MKIKVKKKKQHDKTFIFGIVISLVLIIILYNYLFVASSKSLSAVDNKSINVDTDNLVSLSADEQKRIDKQNKKNMEVNLENGINYIIVDRLNVKLPIYTFSTKLNDKEVAETLEKGALTYSEYGSAGVGNLILFGHNSGSYPKGYFTPIANDLKLGDEIVIKTKNKDYTYKIIDVKTVNENEIEQVYFQSKKPVLTIGTCDVPSEKTTKRLIFSGELIENK